jgi:hypothetical protein
MPGLAGTTVAVTVDGAERTGVVLRTTYTAKYGQPLVAIALDEPLPDGRERHLALADNVARR